MNRFSFSIVALLASITSQAQNPSYTIIGKDTTCQIFMYSPDEHKGLHIACLNDNDKWADLGQVVSSDYGQWGSEKRMFNPFVTQANDGTWRALWGLNNTSPTFAVAYSEDLVVWRPQDYPIVKEKGVNSPIAFQMDDGSWDIYIKTANGNRYVHGSDDFRTFSEDSIPAEVDNILWQKDTATINGKVYEGNTFQVPAIHLSYIYNWLQSLAHDNNEDNEASKMSPLASTPVNATLTLNKSAQKKISDKLIGIFFEDISYAADGGLNADMIQNGDFEYNKEDRAHSWNNKTAWGTWQKETNDWQKENIEIANDKPLTKNNSHYAVVSSFPIYNTGWDGYVFKTNETYDFSFYERNIDIEKKLFRISLIAKTGEEIFSNKIKTEGYEWKKYDFSIMFDKLKPAQQPLLKDARLVLTPLKEGKAAIDLVCLTPHETYKMHGLRKDLADTIAALKPKFVRFPGGCMLHGDGLNNIYNWKESIGPLKDRKPDSNIWHYHQSKKLGFYEYFQWCEDMGAEPLPVLAAGVPCQNSVRNADGIGGQQGGISMENMPAYIQDVLDLIEWANGDPNKSKWAKMREDAGHPAPFNLKMIGIGNEDLISTTFEERYLMISHAVKEKYPDINIIGTVGPFHYPSSDYIEGWNIAKSEKVNNNGSKENLFSAVDEHYYEQPGWFVNHQNYYDDYDRNAPKVYLGEYASRGKNARDNALAEAIHLCNVERNGDVVEMSSYAPLLCKDGHSNWNPDMIYFTNSSVRTTPSYDVQKMFSTHCGDIYVESNLAIAPEYKKWVATSVVRDSKTNKVWLKVVNALPQTLILKVDGKTYNVPAKSWKVYEM